MTWSSLLLHYLILFARSDEVQKFESQMKNFTHGLEEGVDVVMWQLNRSEDKDAPAEFPLKASHVTVKMQKKGDLFVQSQIHFILRGGYLSKAIGRNRGGEYSDVFHSNLLFSLKYTLTTQCSQSTSPLLNHFRCTMS